VPCGPSRPPPDQRAAGSQQRQELFDRERNPRRPFAQVGNELARQLTRAENFLSQRRGVLDTERGQRDVGSTRRRRQLPRDRPHSRIQLVTAEREDHRQCLRRITNEIGDKVDGLLVRPMDVLDHQNARTQRRQHLDEAAKHTVSLGRPVVKRLRRRWQPIGYLGDESTQRARHRGDAHPRQVVPHSSYRLDDRAQRERLMDAPTTPRQEASIADVRTTRQLGHQSGLADPRLPLDENHRRWHRNSRNDPRQLIGSANQSRRHNSMPSSSASRGSRRAACDLMPVATASHLRIRGRCHRPAVLSQGPRSQRQTTQLKQPDPPIVPVGADGAGDLDCHPRRCHGRQRSCRRTGDRRVAIARAQCPRSARVRSMSGRRWSRSRHTLVGGGPLVCCVSSI
jgi:hypothetical protein